MGKKSHQLRLHAFRWLQRCGGCQVKEVTEACTKVPEILRPSNIGYPQILSKRLQETTAWDWKGETWVAEETPRALEVTALRVSAEESCGCVGEVTWSGGSWLPKAFGAQMIPSQAFHDGPGNGGFGVVLLGFIMLQHDIPCYDPHSFFL